MKSLLKKTLTFSALLALSVPAVAKMTLFSEDMSHGSFLKTDQVFNGFGCTGDNKSPQLTWSGAPEGTKSFAVFAYDPDAPTGSGWWHWQLINLPADVTSLAAGTGAIGGEKLPEGAMQLRNDYGSASFGGACPPVNDGAHRYLFTVYALPGKLDIPADASAALAGYMVKANALDSATLQALYKR